MTPLPLSQCPDEDLVEVVRTPRHARQAAAFDELNRRHGALLARMAYRRMSVVSAMVSNAGRGTIEDLVGDVLGQAIQGYRRGRGAAFKTFLARCFLYEMYSAGRRTGKFVASLEPKEDGEIRHERAAAVIPPGSLAHLTLLEINDIAHKALAAMKESERKAFLWAVVLDYSHDQLQDLYPGRSPAALRKVKERVTKSFFAEWERLGGPRAQELLQELGPAMSERLNPDRIKDPTAREAYRAWLMSDLAGAAQKVGLDVERTRALLLSAAHDLYEQATLRGRSRVRAQVLEIGAGAASADPLLASSRRTLALVRAAFGVAPLEAAFTTLGAFVQARLKSAADLEAARKALALSPAEFRRLLADDLHPGAPLLKRLARLLDTPLASLRALPHTPLGLDEVITRGAARLNRDRVRTRALAWLSRARR